MLTGPNSAYFNNVLNKTAPESNRSHFLTCICHIARRYAILDIAMTVFFVFQISATINMVGESKIPKVFAESTWDLEM
ncbi:hypothetical protein Gohar_027925 [Gossypium harknessii]|uniref:Uncharacterized protein n=1 Tax=Gossypium harknessii TaxID=34285 RepID=A0A7J9ICW4_9ROSI|nr:hypothetical protein [Gossypium harknessii]